jgi:hypothetical protein
MKHTSKHMKHTHSSLCRCFSLWSQHMHRPHAPHTPHVEWGFMHSHALSQAACTPCRTSGRARSHTLPPHKGAVQGAPNYNCTHRFFAWSSRAQRLVCLDGRTSWTEHYHRRPKCFKTRGIYVYGYLTKPSKGRIIWIANMSVYYNGTYGLLRGHLNNFHLRDLINKIVLCITIRLKVRPHVMS